MTFRVWILCTEILSPLVTTTTVVDPLVEWLASTPVSARATDYHFHLLGITISPPPPVSRSQHGWS